MGPVAFDSISMDVTVFTQGNPQPNILNLFAILDHMVRHFGSPLAAHS